MPIYKNDSKRLEEEFKSLLTKNQPLYHLILDLELFCLKEFKKSIVITMIGRTDDEQDELYKSDPKYKLKKFKSPHQFWQAVDIRSLTFTADEIKKIEQYLNKKYIKNKLPWTAKNHKVGDNGWHFHIQLVY